MKALIQPKGVVYMENKRKVSVNIFGSDYIMIGEKSEEYIQEIALKVDNIMKEISKSNFRYSPTMIAILTSLNLADALYKSQEELFEINERYELAQAEMLKPQEELDNLKLELEATRDQYDSIFKELNKVQMELGKSNRELAANQEQVKELNFELAVSKENMTDLQNKFFECQIELLKAKKELDYKKHLGNNKNK